jgi:hypothetical protein
VLISKEGGVSANIGQIHLMLKSKLKSVGYTPTLLGGGFMMVDALGSLVWLPKGGEMQRPGILIVYNGAAMRQAPCIRWLRCFCVGESVIYVRGKVHLCRDKGESVAFGGVRGEVRAR